MCCVVPCGAGACGRGLLWGLTLSVACTPHIVGGGTGGGGGFVGSSARILHGFRGVFPCLSCHRPQKDSQATCIVEVETLLLRNLLYPHPGGAEDGAREGEGEGEGEPDSSHIHVARQ